MGGMTDHVRVPILSYHAVSPAPDPRFSEYTVTPAAFEAQVRWLAHAGFHTITPGDLLAARTGGAALPRRPVLITFDDGFRDTVQHAPPVLAAHGFRAVFYLVTGLVAATSRWMVPEVGVELPLFGWEEARMLETAGFICGSHSVTHPRLARVPVERCRSELRDSRQSLEDALGRAVTDLAYPFGSHDDRVVEAAQEAGYLTACTTEEGFSADEPMLRLRRLPVQGRDSLLDFRFRVSTGHTPGGWWQLARERLTLRRVL
jgi:peptidoglycan/xylan/chitin deacetylase (PgdA/CDA1 family)